MSREDGARRIVHDGRTVRRPIGYWTPAVHALLDHLQSVGFEHAPRVIGVTGAVEILSFVEGHALAKGDELWIDDEVITSVGTLLRRYHDAARSFTPLPGARWQPTSIPTTGTLVCHNDLYLGNVVFRDRQAVGIIDFDFAHPADPLWDLAMAAWHWLSLLVAPGHDLVGELPRRLRLLVTAYGTDPRRRQDILAIIINLGHRMRANHADDTEQTDRFDRTLHVLDRDGPALRNALT